MRNESLAGNGRTLSRASATVKQKSQQSRRPIPPPPLPPGLQAPAATPKPDLPPGIMLGAIIFGELLDNSQAMPFCAAVCYLEGVRMLMEHHPDLRVYADALTLVCMGEQKLQELRGDVDDDLLDTALDIRLDAALPLIEARVQHFASVEPTASEYVDALAHIKQGMVILDGLRAGLAAI